jgi:nicotinamide riboside transporter PnuC
MKTVDILIYLITSLSLLGTYLNIKKNKLCFIIWIVTNVSFAIINMYIDMYSQSAVFIIFAILSIYGYLKWKEEDETV